MRTEGPFHVDDYAAVVTAVKVAAKHWGVEAPAIGFWARAAAQEAPRRRSRWRLSYDPALRLLTFEVWADGQCLYGADDIVT